MTRKVAAAFRATHCLQNLRPGRRRLRDHIEFRKAPVRRHLPPAGLRVSCGTHGHQQHVERRRAQSQAQRAISIVGIKPVVAWLQGKARCGANRFMARARDLEEDFLLALEQDLPVVHTPRRVHDPVGLNQPLAGETFVGLACAPDFLVGHPSRLRICLGRHPFSIVNPDRRLRNSIQQWQNR